MSQEWDSLSNNAKNEHERRVITVTRNFYAAYQATETSGWGTNIQSYLPLLKKIIESSTNVKTYSAVVYKNYYSFNISVQFISLTCMNKSNVNFIFVATELQNVKFLYYSVLLNSLRYLTGVYV